MLARSIAAAAALVCAAMSLAGLLQRYLEQPGEHIAQPRLVEVADHAAVVHDRDRASLLGDHHGDRIRLFGYALGGAMARAIAALPTDILAQREHHIGGQNTVAA